MARPPGDDSNPGAIVFLTGMMGAGKTAVGIALARQSDADFIDLDAAIEAATGRSVNALFASGEHEFRRAEADTLRALVGEPDGRRRVVATGGGTPCDPASAALMDAHGVRVFLDVEIDELTRRLGPDERARRPMIRDLTGEPLTRRLRVLVDARRPAYASARYTLDASARPDEVATAVARTIGWRDGVRVGIHVPARPRDYDVILGHGVLVHAGEHVRARVPTARRAFVVTDANVAAHHLGAATAALGPLETTTAIVAPGESSKSLETLARLVDAALAAGVGRADVVVALGGGVVGDLAGLVAATCMRGVPFVQIPTSLLAQVDASVGGKVAVNRPAGKNLLGAFHFPRLVLADTALLETLPPRDRVAGLAEMLKHGALFDPEHFEAVVELGPAIGTEGPMPAELPGLIATSVGLKAACVAADPRERTHGGRELLNLGHTVGHALEHLSAAGGADEAMRHGEAVGLGLRAAARISRRLGLAGPELETRVAAALNACGLPADLDAWLDRLEPEAMAAVIAADKKREQDGVRFVALEALGRPTVVRLAPARFDRLLRGQNGDC